MRIEGHLSATVPEESPAQREGLVLLAELLLGRRVADDTGQPGGVGAVDAVELPGDDRGALDQVLFDFVPGFEVGLPGFDPALRTSGSSPGRTSVFAAMPCFKALNRDRLLPWGSSVPCSSGRCGG